MENFKGIKKEEESLASEFRSQKNIPKIGKAKPVVASTLTGAGSANARKTMAKVKKEEPVDEKFPIDATVSKASRNGISENEVDEKPNSKRVSAVSKVKESSAKKTVDVKPTMKKKIKDEETTPLPNVGKRERKVYDLPGQKRDPPEERDPLRIFYESLYKQRPDSEMAQLWMMESGLLARDLAQKVFDKKQRKNPKLSSSAARNGKSPSSKKKATPPQRPVSKAKETKSGVSSKQSKKRKVDSESDSDSDEEILPKRTLKKQKAAC